MKYMFIIVTIRNDLDTQRERQRKNEEMIFFSRAKKTPSACEHSNKFHRTVINQCVCLRSCTFEIDSSGTATTVWWHRRFVCLAPHRRQTLFFFRIRFFRVRACAERNLWTQDLNATHISWDTLIHTDGRRESETETETEIENEDFLIGRY